MQKSLAGKVALVTGGSRGLGAATALALADKGADVAISYVASADKAQAIVEQLKAKGVRALAVQSDQADPTAAKPLLDAVLAHFGQLDILVNNAAIAVQGKAVGDPGLDTEGLDLQWRINVLGAAAAGDFVVIAVPLKLVNNMPVRELAGKIVIDTNNYMAWRDGLYAVVESGEATEHELRQQQLPTSKVVKAFTHIQAPRIITAGQPAGTPFRLALAVSSDYPEAVELVARLYDQFGFDTVDHSPLSESWRSRPGQPAWSARWRQTLEELEGNLARGRRNLGT